MEKKTKEIKDYANVQYNSTHKLRDRMNLWDFGNNSQPLTEWIYSQFQLKSNNRILELGSGTGRLWVENKKKIPKNCNIILTDASKRMLESLKTNHYFQKDDFTIKYVDAQEIPFPDDSFDTVIACHMLYHVPELENAITEIKRVLKPNGLFYATTTYQDHISELYSLFKQVNLNTSKKREVFSDFWMESGIKLVSKYFSNIKHSTYENIVRIERPNKQILLDYIESMFPKSHFPSYKQKEEKEIEKIIDKKLEMDGYFQVSGRTGIIISQK